MRYVARGRREIYREIYLVNLKVKDSLGDLHMDGGIVLNWIVTTELWKCALHSCDRIK